MQLADPQVLINPTTSSSTDTEDNEASISKEQTPEEDATTRRVGLRFKLFSAILSLLSFLRSKPKITKDTGYERLLHEHCQ